MSKHTPGPWYPVKNGRKDYTVIQDCSSMTICDIDNKHDARLIAAAPELLEACMEFVRKVECGEAKSTASYQQMKAAVAKATGETE